LMRRGAPGSARRLADEALRRERTPGALVAQALLAAAANPPDAERARAFLDDAVALAPSSFDPHFWRAHFLWKLGARSELELILADLDAALVAAPGDWRALNLRLRVLNQLGRGAAARADAEMLLRTPSAALDVELRAETALAAANVGRYTEAASELREYLETHPLNDARWRVLANWRRLAGDQEGAREADENAALARRNGVLEAHRNARLYAAYGAPDEARRMLEAIVARAPDYAPARDDLRALE